MNIKQNYGIKGYKQTGLLAIYYYYYYYYY
jgi:hypothetical protein